MIRDWRGRDYRPDPKPANFDALSAAWNDPAAFAVEAAKYRAQVTRHHHQRRTP